MIAGLLYIIGFIAIVVTAMLVAAAGPDVFDTYQQARVALTRIGEVLGEPSSVPEAEGAVHPGPLTGRTQTTSPSGRMRMTNESRPPPP